MHGCHGSLWGRPSLGVSDQRAWSRGTFDRADYVRPFVKRNKNDAADAEAIAEAASRPTMRFVEAKSGEASIWDGVQDTRSAGATANAGD